MLRSLAVSTGRSFQGGSNGGKPPIRPGTIAAGGIFATFLGLLFYRTHLQECPITKRRKFIMFSDQTIRKMAAQESVKIQNKFRARLVKSGEEYRHVMGISSRILSANQSLPGIKREWRVFVIEDKRTLNAFVLPNGHIFVFSGMIKAVTNEDQLATVLGHEIAHALLNHVGEQISKSFFFELLLLLPVALLWVVLPDAAAIFSQRLAEYMHTVLFKLPMSRQLETEADVVGLRMMARACYDPREAVQLWNMMARMSKGESVEWLSTHPSHTTRSQTLQQFMQEAMGIRAKHCK